MELPRGLEPLSAVYKAAALPDELKEHQYRGRTIETGIVMMYSYLSLSPTVIFHHLLCAAKCLVTPRGLEPRTFALKGRCSTIEL